MFRQPSLQLGDVFGFALGESIAETQTLKDFAEEIPALVLRSAYSNEVYNAEMILGYLPDRWIGCCN